MPMTALEYMEKQVQKHNANFNREMKRGASDEILANIAHKINYYETAVKLLRERKDNEN